MANNNNDENEDSNNNNNNGGIGIQPPTLMDEAAQRRERELEEWLAAQDSADRHHHDHDGDNNDNINNARVQDDDNILAAQQRHQQWQQQQQQQQQDVLLPEGMGANLPPAAAAAATIPSTTIKNRLSYVQASFLTAFGLLYYAYRSRQQWYLTLVYLSSSKWAYVVFGNASVALAISVFDVVSHLFLNGLRLQEAEGLQDFFRWNVTESCLALTLFRSEIKALTAVQFLALVLLKCLHHVVILRETHIRLTTEGVIIVPHQNNNNRQIHDAQQQQQNQNNNQENDGGGFGEGHVLGIAAPPPEDLVVTGTPMIPWAHIKVLLMMLVLQFLDLYIVQYTALNLINNGPSVHVLFAFEGAILLVAAWSHLLLWHLHAMDGLLHAGHEQGSRWLSPLLHPWKEYKATLTFAVELQAQAIQFIFYLTFFTIILTYWGMPINLFREVYLSFTALKERLFAFLKYRRLMANMNTHFQNIETDATLDELGRVCIICRDEMTIHDCKQLPVCNHIFHKSCLREWLVQQQTCPTCRSDITANQAIEATRRAAARAAAEREQVGEGATQAGTATTTTGVEGGDSTAGATDTAGATSTGIKTVRFGTPAPDGSKNSKQYSFPALYRVTAGQGATVWMEGPPPQQQAAAEIVSSSSATACRRRYVRGLSKGVVVLCTDAMVEDDQQKERHGCVKLLRVPDGWVKEEALEHVHTL